MNLSTIYNLLSDLNDLCETLDSEYNLNNGGCCYAAAVISQELEKRDIPFLFGFTNESNDVYGAYHYVIYALGYIINQCDSNDDEFRFISMDSNDIGEMYYNGNWNECYSKRWNLIVLTKIRALFKKYDNN